MRRHQEWLTFLGEFRRQFHSTGALLPSSRFLAHAITHGLDDGSGSRRFLEAGPGTGAFTAALLRRLRPGDQLVLVELNDRFVQILQKRLDSDPNWQPKRHQVELRHGSALDVPGHERFHAVVCGLPFNNFDPELVERFLAHFLDRLEPGGSFRFFEYWAIRELKKPFVARAERERLARIAAIIEEKRRQCRAQQRRVLLNVPPAVVHHLSP